MIAENVNGIRAKIDAACQRAGRDPGEVTLVCVTKGIAVENIHKVLESGIKDIGENRVQEARIKHQEIGNQAVWHMVGHLQTNKVPDALTIFSLIHSLDSVRLADAINTQAQRLSKIQDVLIQVNISGEDSKYGISPDMVPDFVRSIAGYPHLRVRGLMGIARIMTDPEEARPSFAMLRAVFDKGAAPATGTIRMEHLSMGMSQDFEVAVEEGSTMVRIGTAIFQD